MQAIDTSLGQFPYERLLLELLDQQDTFERLLAVEHVDDKLMNKQVSVFEEEDIVLHPQPEKTDDLSAQIDEFEPRFFGVLHDIAFVNRQRRIWRLFKDWNPGHRPW
jgi:virulence-associated protein VagC